MNTAEIIPVNLFKPASALFCDEKRWLAPPIPAIPSPFGECNRIKITNKIAEIICIIQVSVSMFYVPYLFLLFVSFLVITTVEATAIGSFIFGFDMKCALFEFNFMSLNV